MLYFRFDFNKEDFKGKEHKSIAYGYEVEDIVDFLFDEESEQLKGYYLDSYKKLQEQYDNEEISENEYDKKVIDLKQEYIRDELTLDGCSCFELNEEGINFSNRYGYDDRKIITIFEGQQKGFGHDGEVVAKCEKIVWQGDSNKITDIFYDDDLTSNEKINKILDLIK